MRGGAADWWRRGLNVPEAAAVRGSRFGCPGAGSGGPGGSRSRFWGSRLGRSLLGAIRGPGGSRFGGPAGPGAGRGLGGGPRFGGRGAMNGAMNGAEAPPGPVWLSVSSSLNAFRACKRFSPALTIAELKCKLELVVGSPASCMELELFGAEDEPLGPLAQDEALLGSYPVTDGCRIHVTDRSGARVGEFEDLSQVPKYEMAESDYEKRTESMRSFLRQRSWGRWDIVPCPLSPLVTLSLSPVPPADPVPPGVPVPPW
ncbi:tubulin-folding cofactor B isoform X2 [Chiroxiphia lanceolata]|uniref:tubulin-folding cofactor B isoform X2 n=1 Tax=Chiroxiphia lanceolata TaxID=296741 RepID=UPI0013CE9DFA|nr:tubulin-folding cofactor B isoform X2 [Chiroxiphia lanceolata]